MFHAIKAALLVTLLASTFTSCYRMPTEDDYCLIPATNNRDLTRESPSNNLMPGVGY